MAIILFRSQYVKAGSWPWQVSEVLQVHFLFFSSPFLHRPAHANSGRAKGHEMFTAPQDSHKKMLVCMNECIKVAIILGDFFLKPFLSVYISFETVQ